MYVESPMTVSSMKVDMPGLCGHHGKPIKCRKPSYATTMPQIFLPFSFRPTFASVLLFCPCVI